MWICPDKVTLCLAGLLLAISLNVAAEEALPDKALLDFLADMQEMTEDHIDGWLKEDMPLPDSNDENTDTDTQEDRRDKDDKQTEQETGDDNAQ